MKVRKLCKQKGMKTATKQTSTEARIAALKSQLRINSQHKKGDANQRGESPKKLE